MRAGFVIVAEVIFEQTAQVVVTDDDHMIQALATNASNHPLHIAVLPRTSRCDTNLLDAHSFNPRPEAFTVDSVAVADHEPRSTVFWKRFDDLLCSPNRRRILRHIEVDHAATIVRQDDEDIQNSQLNRCDRKEIDGYHLPDMISKERHPRLRGFPVFGHQSRNGSLRNLKPEFQQFSMNARRS